MGITKVDTRGIEVGREGRRLKLERNGENHFHSFPSINHFHGQALLWFPQTLKEGEVSIPLLSTNIGLNFLVFSSLIHHIRLCDHGQVALLFCASFHLHW